MGTDDHERMYPAGKKHVMSARGHHFAEEILSAGRHGNCSMSRRDGMGVFNGRVFFGRTGRYVTTVREFVGGTGRWDKFDGGFTVPFRRYRRYPPAEIP